MKKIYFLLFLIMAFALTSFTIKNQNYPNTTEQSGLYIYKITYSEDKYLTVSGFANVGEKIYFEPKDSLLMTYKGLSPNARLIDNESLNKFLADLKDKLHDIDDYANCKCTAITKNEYIVRIVKGEEVNEFVFTEVLLCNPTSPCKFIEDLHYYFEEYD